MVLTVSQIEAIDRGTPMAPTGYLFGLVENREGSHFIGGKAVVGGLPLESYVGHRVVARIGASEKGDYVRIYSIQAIDDDLKYGKTGDSIIRPRPDI